MKVMDLYHHLSRPLYWDMDNKKIIDGQKVADLNVDIRKRIAETKGVIDHGWYNKDDIKADIWKIGEPTKLYGRIYEI